MKKIFSLMMVLAAVAMVSCCGGNKKANAEAEAVATETVAEEAACCEKSDNCCEKCDSCTCSEKCDSCTCGEKCAEAAAEAPAEEAK